PRVVWGALDEGRPEEPPLVDALRRAAARQDPRSAVDGVLELLEELLPAGVGVHRAHAEHGLLGLRPAGAAFVALELLHEPVDDVVVDLVEDVQPLHRKARLARVPEPRDYG